MAELLHRLRTKHMLIEVYEDLVLLNGPNHIVRLPPTSIWELHVVPMKLLRDGCLEMHVEWLPQQLPVKWTIALPPDRKKEAVAQRLTDTVRRLKSQGIGTGQQPGIQYKILTRDGVDKLGEEGESFEITAALWRGQPAIKYSCGDKTLGYTLKDRFTAWLYKLAKKNGGLRARIVDGAIYLEGFQQEEA